MAQTFGCFSSSEKRAAERREQYKLVKAHVKKDESGRLHAYGWSIPAADRKQPTVPVPIYCRPVFDVSSQKANKMKIWCAAGIQLTGGRGKDGTYMAPSQSMVRVFFVFPS